MWSIGVYSPRVRPYCGQRVLECVYWFRSDVMVPVLDKNVMVVLPFSRYTTMSVPPSCYRSGAINSYREQRLCLCDFFPYIC